VSARYREIDGQSYKPVEVAATAAGSIDGAKFLAEICPAEKIDIMPAPVVANRLPYQFSWWGKIFYASPDVFEWTLPLHLFSAQSAVIVGHDGGLELSNGRFYEPKIRYLKYHLPTSLFRRADDQLWVSSEQETAAPPGNYFFVFNAEWRNYAHVLTDQLPLIFLFKDRLPDDYKLIVPTLSDSILYTQLLDLFEIDITRLYVMPHQRVRFETLYFTTEISGWSQTELLYRAADALVERVLARHGVDPARKPAARRLYLSREDAGARRLLNEPALVKALQPFGFEPIQCSALRLEEQVLLFQQAQIVVAPHGAALANILFCAPGASVLELFPEYCVQPNYRGMSAWRKLKYGNIVGTSFEHENSRTVTNSWSNDFVVDVDLVVSAVATMIGEAAAKGN
jgi:capsular polysaccharide biosynthesis protein